MDRMKRFKDALSAAVVKVGHGRGFVAQYRREYPPFKDGKPVFTTERLIITAAHCLPRLPRSLFDERPYKKLIGKLDTPKSQRVWAQCMFVDPVSDVAILCEPDSQALPEQWEPFIMLTDELPALKLGSSVSGRVWILSLTGEWVPVSAKEAYGRLMIEDTPANQGGVSGSPLLADDGSAVGLMSWGSDSNSGSSQPLLKNHLPGWLSRQTRRSR